MIFPWIRLFNGDFLTKSLSIRLSSTMSGVKTSRGSSNLDSPPVRHSIFGIFLTAACFPLSIILA